MSRDKKEGGGKKNEAPAQGGFEDPHELSPEMAGQITRALLEFDAVNRLRQLANQLMEAGVTFEKFHAWNRLCKQAELHVPLSLSVDVMNLISSLQKGIEIKDNALIQTTPAVISRDVKKAIAAQTVLNAASGARAAANKNSPRSLKP